jgi:hypothetical protein
LGDNDNHFTHSVLRELIVEHLFIGLALQRFWRSDVFDVEILRSGVDVFGYDLVMTWGKIVRHILFKTSKLGGKARAQKIGTSLAEKPSGCVIWVIVTDSLEFESFLWFGNAPGLPLPPIENMPIAKHTRGTKSLSGIRSLK